MNTPDHIAWRIAKTTYVVLMKDSNGKLNLVVDIGMGRPWSSKNKKMADQVASECDGMAATFEEAFKLLIKDNPAYEKDLEKLVLNRLADKAERMKAPVLRRPMN